MEHYKALMKDIEVGGLLEFGAWAPLEEGD